MFLLFCVVYEGDESFVPKNASVVVKRMPVAGGNGLLTRLKNRNSAPAV